MEVSIETPYNAGLERLVNSFQGFDDYNPFDIIHMAVYDIVNYSTSEDERVYYFKKLVDTLKPNDPPSGVFGKELMSGILRWYNVGKLSKKSLTYLLDEIPYLVHEGYIRQYMVIEFNKTIMSYLKTYNEVDDAIKKFTEKPSNHIVSTKQQIMDAFNEQRQDIKRRLCKKPDQ